MRLNHLNLCVDNLSEACALFQTCFDLAIVEQRGEAIAVLADGHGFTLVLSHLRAAASGPPSYPDGFHVGFIQETPEQVDQIYRRLLTADVQLAHEPRKMRGSYGFYFTALKTILFEVSAAGG